VKVVSRAAGQALSIGGHAIVSVSRIEDGYVRLGVRCPGDWEVRQIELDGLKRGGNTRPWRKPPDPIWHGFSRLEADGADASAAESAGRRSCFFVLPVNGGLKIGPVIHLQVTNVKKRFALLGIDGVAEDEVLEV
jgi:sRNA-binding carbon storage regulator CsrA